jgi:glycosyltransferase involved in cell wall biosynthesis
MAERVRNRPQRNTQPLVRPTEGVPSEAPTAWYERSDRDATRELGMDRREQFRRLLGRTPTGLRRAVWRAARLLEGALRIGRRVRMGRALPTPDPMPVTFLIWNAYVLGGTARTINQQANALARRGHDVEVISVERRAAQHEPFFPLDPRVRLTTLLDHGTHQTRTGPGGALARWLHDLPSVLVHPREGRAKEASLLIDLRLIRALGRVRRGVVIGSRLGLNLIVARFAHPAATAIAQEHLYLDVYKPPLPDGIRRHVPKLDAVAVLTEADAARYRRFLADDPVPVVSVPNAVSEPLPEPADPASRRVVAVAHLTARGKGMDRVVPAFGKIAPQHPDWELRLVGAGSKQPLSERASVWGIREQVHFTGPSRDVAGELAAGSVLVMPSRAEAFSLVLIEGMAAGLAVVSFDCIQGPRDILTPGQDALVVPQGDVEALADALHRVMADDDLRARLGANARDTVRRRYLLGTVTDRWLALFRAADEHRVRGRFPGDLLTSCETSHTLTSTQGDRELPTLSTQVARATSSPSGSSHERWTEAREPYEQQSKARESNARFPTGDTRS